MLISVELTDDVAYYILGHSVLMFLGIEWFYLVRKSDLEVNSFAVWVKGHVKY